MMEQNIILSKKEMEHINEVLKLTVEEICQKYGYKKDSNAISHFTVFPNGIAASINLRLVDEDDWAPITDITLFKNGEEVTHYTEGDCRYEGIWCIEYEGIEYVVNVIEEE